MAQFLIAELTSFHPDLDDVGDDRADLFIVLSLAVFGLLISSIAAACGLDLAS